MDKVIEWLSAMEKMCDWSNLILIGMLLFFFYKTKPVWLNSIRSILSIILGYTFCYGFLSKLIDPKDFLLVVSMIFNFYFILKRRSEENGKTPATT